MREKGHKTDNAKWMDSGTDLHPRPSGVERQGNQTKQTGTGKESNLEAKLPENLAGQGNGGGTY